MVAKATRLDEKNNRSCGRIRGMRTGSTENDKPLNGGVDVTMRLLKMMFALPIALSLGISAAVAGDYGTPAEAKAMLEKAVAELKADESAALAKFSSGEGGFKDRDLYPFCGGPDGNFTAHPKLAGKPLKGLQDKGNPPKDLGDAIYASAVEGKISEVTYQWPRPGETEPRQKVAYVTKVGDQTCAVGYYE